MSSPIPPRPYYWPSGDEFIAPPEVDPRFRQVRYTSRLNARIIVGWVDSTLHPFRDKFTLACPCRTGHLISPSTLEAFFLAHPKVRRLPATYYFVCACNSPQWLE